MLTASQWAQIRALDEALAINSTRGGQRRLHEQRKVAVGVLPATKSNPHGLGTVIVPAPVNPLTVLTTKGQPKGNLMKVASGTRKTRTSYSPASRFVTLRDCVKQNGPLPGNE